jgi:hypothetical protein
MPQHSLSVVREVSTGERLRELLTRVGQREFSDVVRENDGTKCCFPDCDVAERTFLRGSHIARWADEPDLRGDVSNGLSLCLMHDQAFERGLFTVDLELRVWVDSAKARRSPWATVHLAPYHGRDLRLGTIPPSEEALLQHWERTRASVIAVDPPSCSRSVRRNPGRPEPTPPPAPGPSLRSAIRGCVLWLAAGAPLSSRMPALWD